MPTANNPAPVRENNSRGNTITSLENEVPGDFQQLLIGCSDSVRTYGDKHPAVLTSLVFFAGFYLGWKIRPW